jgi:hypothetical protein
MPLQREIASAIDIAATATRVWDILVDFRRYPEWNPFIRRIVGSASPGACVRFRFEWPPLRGPACAIVSSARPGAELCWAGGVPGVFRAEHYMRIEPLDSGRVRFHHGERFSGLLVPAAWTLLLARHGPAVYENTCLALQRRAQAT